MSERSPPSSSDMNTVGLENEELKLLVRLIIQLEQGDIFRYIKTYSQGYNLYVRKLTQMAYRSAVFSFVSGLQCTGRKKKTCHARKKMVAIKRKERKVYFTTVRFGTRPGTGRPALANFIKYFCTRLATWKHTHNTLLHEHQLHWFLLLSIKIELNFSAKVQYLLCGPISNGFANLVPSLGCNIFLWINIKELH